MERLCYISSFDQVHLGHLGEPSSCHLVEGVDHPFLGAEVGLVVEGHLPSWGEVAGVHPFLGAEVEGAGLLRRRTQGVEVEVEGLLPDQAGVAGVVVVALQGQEVVEVPEAVVLLLVLVLKYRNGML